MTNELSLNAAIIGELLKKQYTLVAVTKTLPVDIVKEMISLGVKNIGENRVEEFEEKYSELKEVLKISGCKAHLIGHLQSNKAKKAVRLFDVIQSVDSEKIARKINDEAGRIGKIIEVMIQVNIGREPQKSGIAEEEVSDLYAKIKDLPNIKVIGIMCIAPDIPAEQTRPYFRKMRALKDKLELKELSMGMTNDYKIALQEGATMVRLGRALYRGKCEC